MNNKFSIITCTYNSEKYLSDTIASVKAQNYKNFEHIFVDAYSDDKTVEIIEAYQKEFPTQVKIFNQKPNGITSAMNFGVEKAAGEIICHLHSDDMFYDESVLENVTEAFRSDEIQWCYGNLLVVNSDGSEYNREYPSEFSYSKLLKKNFIPHPATFIRKTFFCSLGGFNNYKYAMDYDLWLRASKIAKPVKVNKFLARFRRHEDSLSTKEFENTLREDYNIRTLYQKNALKNLVNFIFYKINIVKYRLYIIKNRFL